MNGRRTGQERPRARQNGLGGTMTPERLFDAAERRTASQSNEYRANPGDHGRSRLPWKHTAGHPPVVVATEETTMTAPASPIPETIPLRRAADLLGKHERTVRRWIERGDLAAVKIGGRIAIPLDALSAAVKPVEPR